MHYKLHDENDQHKVLLILATKALQKSKKIYLSENWKNMVHIGQN